MKERITIDVYNGKQWAPVGEIERVPVAMVGWQWVRYHGKRYQLHGGIRTAYGIDLRLPLAPRTGYLPAPSDSAPFVGVGNVPAPR